ncbi:MAG: hypothetical protein RJA70_2594 [Pseudomonadota bacterium]|jgi:small ligand-binding sensory domain FIST
MGAPAVSFVVQSASPAHIALKFRDALSQVPRATAGLVFCSGAAAQNMETIAQLFQSLAPSLPMVFLSGPGVLSERGELDETAAVSGLIWEGGSAELRRVEAQSELRSDTLGHLLRPLGPRQPPTLLFIRSEDFQPEALWSLRDEFPSPLIFGAGTYGDPGIVCAGPDGVHKAAAAALHLRGPTVPRVHTAHSCRLLSAPLPITRHEGALVLEVGGEPALNLVQRIGSALEGQPLVLTVLANPQADLDSPRELLVRGIQGIDPDKRALLVSAEVTDGLLLTFGVRDARAARADLESLCRRVSREIAGASPQFILYFNCSGRGRALHGTGNVDTRLLRERFVGVPIAGFTCAFEIAPFAGAPALQLHTGVLAIFSTPS